MSSWCCRCHPRVPPRSNAAAVTVTRAPPTVLPSSRCTPLAPESRSFSFLACTHPPAAMAHPLKHAFPRHHIHLLLFPPPQIPSPSPSCHCHLSSWTPWARMSQFSWTEGFPVVFSGWFLLFEAEDEWVCNPWDVWSVCCFCHNSLWVRFMVTVGFHRTQKSPLKKKTPASLKEGTNHLSIFYSSVDVVVVLSICSLLGHCSTQKVESKCTFQSISGHPIFMKTNYEFVSCVFSPPK